MVKKGEFNLPLREPLNDVDVNLINHLIPKQKREGTLYLPFFVKYLWA
jgi:hypothetical protein